MPQLVIYRVTYLPDFASLSNPSGSFIAVRIVMDAWPCRPLLRFDPLRVHALGKDQRTSRRCGRSILRDKEPVHQQTIVIAIPPFEAGRSFLTAAFRRCGPALAISRKNFSNRGH